MISQLSPSLARWVRFAALAVLCAAHAARVADAQSALSGDGFDLVRWLGDADDRYAVIAVPRPLPEGAVGIERRLLDAATGSVEPLFDHAALAASLRRDGDPEFNAFALPIEAISVDIVPNDGAAPASPALRIVALLAEGRPPIRIERDGRIEPASPEDLRPLERPPLPSRRAAEGRARDAGASGASTALLVENRSAAPVRLLWVTGDRVVPYATIAPGERHRQHTFAGHLWEIVDEAGTSLGFTAGENEPRLVSVTGRTADANDAAAPATPTTPAPSEDAARRPRSAPPSGVPSPDGRLVASIEEGALVLRGAERAGEEPTPEPIARLADEAQGVAFVPPIAWSPDGRSLVLFRRESGEGRRINLIEAAPRDRLEPRLRSIPYAKPGDRLDVVRPRLVAIDASGGDARLVAIDESLMPEPWSIDRLHWRPDGSGFDLLYNQRGHAVVRLITVDASNGATRTLVEERSDTFVDYPDKILLHRLDRPIAVEGSDPRSAFLWTTQRSGHNHLELRDAETGALLRELTRGAFAPEAIVRGLDRVDEEAGVLWCRVSGTHPGRDPYHVHLARVPLDGRTPSLVTDGDGTHRWRWSPRGRRLLASWSRVDRAPTLELRDPADGRLIATLAEPTAAAGSIDSSGRIERFAAKGRDGATDVWGVLVVPDGFDPTKRYPIVECVYAGPHGAHAPVAFGATRGLEEMANAGFVVAMIDGMGTNHRGRAFHDIAWRNLKDAGFPDRIAWLKAAAVTRPWMDLERVGIYGGSAGGQNAMRALLDHHDFYSVAVADCGCHDNRMDKVWWNELWMGWPVDDAYAASSNAVDAHRLGGRLLLIVGALDDNVDPSSTMQVVDALIRADKDFELLVIPSAGHGAAETPYGKRRRLEFLTRHLGE